MKSIQLSKLLPMTSDNESRLRAFALLNLGIVDSLSDGTLAISEAVQHFFNAENCLAVRKKLHDKVADEVMGRGLQLQDLFDILPARQARQEFQQELRAIRMLCRRLLKPSANRPASNRIAVKH